LSSYQVLARKWRPQRFEDVIGQRGVTQTLRNAIAAKRIAQSLDAMLVDDNRRPLDDAALNAIREQVRNTAAALREVRIEPGSARALALFGG